jgi:transcriptional regulator with XRE-family HTH domain
MTNLRDLLAYNIKERRRILGITQEKLAEKISTSTHYIGQIEQKNKFPSPEMLERIAAALEIDSPQLFSMTSFSSKAIQQFKEGVLSDLETAISQAIAQSVDTKLSEIKKMSELDPNNP